jgi:hypothetical protein
MKRPPLIALGFVAGPASGTRFKAVPSPTPSVMMPQPVSDFEYNTCGSMDCGDHWRIHDS